MAAGTGGARELGDLHRRLAACKISDAEWHGAPRIQARQTLAEANRRRQQRHSEQTSADAPEIPLSVMTILAGLSLRPSRCRRPK
jgi:hypothetical protein